MNQYKDFKDILVEYCGQENVIVDALMKEHTCFKVGGPADILVTPSTAKEIAKIVAICRKNNIPYIVIGNGSNILVKDGGIDGVVIKLEKMKKIEVNENKIKADCGAMLADVSKLAVKHSLTGAEFACGIPGTIGGAVFMNAGAYNGEMSFIMEEAEVLDKDGNVITLHKDQLELGYRTSAVMTHGYIVLTATISLEKGTKEVIADRVDDLTHKREDKQPLEYASAGSTFKRPEGYFAGKLIQDSGLKGYTIGNACVSEKHSGFVINKGGASASDILAVIKHVQDTVKVNFDVELHTEVRIIGKDK
ncbi:UDP-N-acetylmuramate dehydrogenase [uncultured Clostridium sp.]|jgi:UDP-N-acetylmuramate dehydrogenase|uniref:UDP-N-acetylmuramate dehydrogenase n=1 Tax=uncultured Clostridium sp. TaxID=59620 RepID=UPI00260EA724|nr:UDP-N-acetylmuramate dehydrogenase [uncultured Clostridium sp.]